MEKDYKARNALAQSVITKKLTKYKELSRAQLVDFVNAEFAKVGYEPIHPSTFDSIICSMVNNEICEKTQRARYELSNTAVRERFSLSEKINEAIRLTDNYLSSIEGLITGYEYISADAKETEAIESVKQAYTNIASASDNLLRAKNAIEESIDESNSNEVIPSEHDEPYEDMDDEEGLEMGM